MRYASRYLKRIPLREFVLFLCKIVLRIMRKNEIDVAEIFLTAPLLPVMFQVTVKP